jgi:hypothetical protein
MVWEWQARLMFGAEPPPTTAKLMMWMLRFLRMTTIYVRFTDPEQALVGCTPTFEPRSSHYLALQIPPRALSLTQTPFARALMQSLGPMQLDLVSLCLKIALRPSQRTPGSFLCVQILPSSFCHSSPVLKSSMDNHLSNERKQSSQQERLRK